MLNEALAYEAAGLSVIPLKPRDKRPVIEWTPFQTERAGKATVSFWWSSWPRANIGIVTGRISNLVVVDCDGTKSLKHLRRYIRASLVGKIPLVSTGNGIHLYFRHPNNMEIRNRGKLFGCIDVRGDGGYVVAPPSIHASGKTYKWETTIDALNAPELTPELLTLITSESTPNLIEKDAPKRTSSVTWETIAVSSRAGHGPYRVRLMSSGNWTCQCDGFVKGHHICHHIKEKKIEWERMKGHDDP